jgi:hypothetical protein
MAIVINPKMNEAFGHQYEEGFAPAYDHDRQLKGVIHPNGDFKMTFPLNGHRARNLAEEVLGERDASLWTIGKCMVVSVDVLKELPGFDQKYYDMFDSMKALGAIITVVRVVEIDPGYGCHIILESGLGGNTIV